jgi:NAD(P)-dependent dehydrogenase (short-subunit alcohol dehydrogenase family)
MLLENKTAIIYGAGGAVGGAIARVFAREGAKVFLTGHHLAKVDAVAHDISTQGGLVETAQVDALDEKAVKTHMSAVEKEAGSIDVSFNAIGIPQQGIQGIPLTELSVDSFAFPITTYTKAQFLTARAAARRMVAKRSGVILMHTPEPARLCTPLVGGMAPAWAAMEAFSRCLSADLGGDLQPDSHSDRCGSALSLIWFALTTRVVRSRDECFHRYGDTECLAD